MTQLQTPDPGLMARLRTSGEDLAWAADRLRDWPHQTVDDIWSAHHQLKHLIAVETENYHVRIARILNEHRPALASWDSQGFDARYTVEGDLDVLIKAFEAERRRTIEMFDALTPEQWRRPAVWPDGSGITMEWLAEKALWHTLDHMQQMVDLHQEFTAAQS